MIKRLGKEKYLVRVSLGTINGKVKLHNRTIYGKREEAESYERKIISQRKQGLPITPTKLTLEVYLKRWLDNRISKKVIRPNTAEEYENVLTRYVIPRCGSTKLADIRSSHVEDVMESMTEKGLSPNTIRHCVTVWHSALKRAIKQGLIHANPIDAVELPAKQRPQVRAFNRDEALKFLDSSREDRYHVLFNLALYAGMRPEELVGLQRANVDLKASIIKVRTVIVWLKGSRWEFSTPKTKRGYRDIPIPRFVSNLLKEHMRQQSEQSMKVRRFYRDDLDLVFADRLGLPLRYEHINEDHINPICALAELGHASLYTFRHTFASLLLEAGENVKVVSEMLGHASVVITMDVYQHVLPSISEGASRKLEKLLEVSAPLH
ncbi:MAG: integrase [Acidobacteriota bacterium]|jgi:integrase|nr:integrase [Acidobacteriota bacterium]